jgi:hypothetical protein
LSITAWALTKDSIVPWINGKDIVAYWNFPKENGFEKVTLIWQAKGGLLITNQVGATCGIYALHAAANVLGKHYAIPPAKKQDVDPNWRQTWKAGGSIAAQRPASIRAIAKRDELSQLGEISGAADLQTLAASIGIATKILNFRDVDELWQNIVTSIEAGDAIVFPYTAVGDVGEVAGIKGPDDFTHWGLLCGYALEKGDSRFVFMTTYSHYHMDNVEDLYKSNLAIQDWSAQRWGKINLWTKEPPGDWKFWQTTWMPELGIQEILANMAGGSRKEGLGFAIGTKREPIYILCDPGAPAIVLPGNSVPVVLLTKSVDLKYMPYNKSMAGKCVAVTKA